MILFCLALFMALALESNRTVDESQLQLDVPAERTADQEIGSAPDEGVMALDVELSRLLDAIQQGFGESSIQIAPTLRPYAYRLAGRMNIRPGAYRIRVAAPSRNLAEARAQVLGRLFESAGVVSSRLTFVPRSGIHSLTADPA